MNNNSDKIKLEMRGIKCDLYSPKSTLMIDFKIDSAYSIVNNKIGINSIDYDRIKYTILKNNETFIYGMSFNNAVQYIMVDNNINSLILNLDRLDINKIGDSLIIQSDNRIYNNSETKPEFIYSIYNKVKYNNIYKGNQWKIVDIGNYILKIWDIPIQLYAKTDKSGELLIGFCFNSYIYNYFKCKNIIRKTITFEDDNPYNDKKINKINLRIQGKPYSIQYNTRLLDIIKLYITICKGKNKDIKIKYNNLYHVEFDNYIFKSNNDFGLYCILLRKENIDNISFEDNSGNIIKLQDLINKIQLLGIETMDKSYYKNMEIHTIIPETMTKHTHPNDNTKYDYMIFIN